MNRIVFWISILTFTSLGCQRTEFGFRKAALGKSVFTNDELPKHDDTDGSITQPSTGGDAGGSVPQPGTGGEAGGSVPQPGTGGDAGGSVPQPGHGAPVGGTVPQPGLGDLFGGLLPQPGIGNPIGGGIPQPGTPPAGGTLPQPPAYPAPAPTPSPAPAEGTVPQPGATPVSFPVKFICAADATNEAGTNIARSKAIQLKIMDMAGKVVCDLTNGVREKILSTKAIDLSACNLTGNSYKAQIFDTGKPAKDLFYTSGNVHFNAEYVQMTRPNAESPWSARPISSMQLKGDDKFWDQAVSVIYANNPLMDKSFDDKLCDLIASPLVINMTASGAPDHGMDLTSPEQGIWFDILGQNSFPYAYSKKQISWIQNPNYMFLALPTHGRVDGVDELFGNNTLGPDYTFADNGFAALAKYDLNHDGVINHADPIYSELRLWSDRNSDGISRESELKSLSELGITEIDLNYDKTYFEEDQYGNQSRYRSTVSTLSGQLHVIFDLWFVIR